MSSHLKWILHLELLQYVFKWKVAPSMALGGKIPIEIHYYFVNVFLFREKWSPPLYSNMVQLNMVVMYVDKILSDHSEPLYSNYSENRATSWQIHVY